METKEKRSFSDVFIRFFVLVFDIGTDGTKHNLVLINLLHEIGLTNTPATIDGYKL